MDFDPVDGSTGHEPRVRLAKVLHTFPVEEPIKDMIIFQDRLYVLTERSLYWLDGETLRLVKFDAADRVV